MQEGGIMDTNESIIEISELIRYITIAIYRGKAHGYSTIQINEMCGMDVCEAITTIYENRRLKTTPKPHTP